MKIEIYLLIEFLVGFVFFKVKIIEIVIIEINKYYKVDNYQGSPKGVRD